MEIVLVIAGGCVAGIALGLGIFGLGCWLIDRRYPRRLPHRWRPREDQ